MVRHEDKAIFSRSRTRRDMMLAYIEPAFSYNFIINTEKL